MADMGPDKTDSDWRARPSADNDDGPPKRDDAFGESESEMSLFVRQQPYLFHLYPRIILSAVLSRRDSFLCITSITI